MATNFPTALDTLTNPTPTDQLDSVTVPHDLQHANANDALEALQAKVGINSSTDVNSLDYKIRHIGILDAGMLLGASLLGLDYLCPYVISTGATSSLTATNGRTIWVPFVLNETITLSSLNIKVATAQAGGAVIVGIYDATTGHLPNALLASSPSLDCSTAGIKTYTLGTPITLNAKTIYFVAVFGASSGTAPSLTAAGTQYSKSVLHTQDAGSVTNSYLAKDSETGLQNPSSVPSALTGGTPHIVMLGASR